MANPHPVSRKGKPNKPKAGAAIVTDATADEWRSYTESGQFKEDLKSLPPIDRLRMMTHLAKFIAPTLKSIDANVNAEVENRSIEEQLRRLCEENDV